MASSERLRDVEAAALEEEVLRLEHRIARAWQLFTVVGIAGALAVALLVSRTLGLWCALVATAYLGWFSLYAALLRRGRTRGAARVAAIVVESTIPWAFLLAVVYAESAAYALTSWVPPMLFGGVMVAWTARLRPAAPLFLGLFGAVGYPALYFALLRQRIDPALAHLAIYQPTMQFTRGASLLFGGTLCAVVTQALRLVFARAHRKMRAQDLFGKYRIGDRVASGGMATVYRALYCPEGGFERAVAVKRIHPHLALRPNFVASFRVEAELCARLVHPNIVQVLDFGRTDESYFLAMEYVDGLTLRMLMQRARRAAMPLSPPLCAFVVRELLAGLAYSHAGARDAGGALLRVVHRDLSPANVLLSRHGEVKITDFGVAKALRDAAVSETRTIAGHLAYMAPEQAAAQPIDERCDLFAVGVIVWELLCGRPLFLRDGEGPTLLALMNYEVPPPSRERADLDRGWDAIVARALARPVGERYRSAAEMAADLNRLPDARVAGASEALARMVADLDALPHDVHEDTGTEEVPTRVVG